MELITTHFDSTLPFVKFSTEFRNEGEESSFEIVAFNIEADDVTFELSTDELIAKLKELYPEADAIKEHSYSGHILRTPYCLYEAMLIADYTIASLDAQVAWNRVVGAHTPVSIKGPKYARGIDPKAVAKATLNDSVTFTVEPVESRIVGKIESINPNLDFTCTLRSIAVGDELEGEFFEQIRGTAMVLVNLNGVTQFMDLETDAEQTLSLLLGTKLKEKDGEGFIEVLAIGTEFFADAIDTEEDRRLVIYMEHEPDGHWGAVLRTPIMEAHMGKRDNEASLKDVRMLVGTTDEKLELFSEQMEAMMMHGLSNM